MTHETAPDNGASETRQAGEFVGALQSTMSQFLSAADVSAVYGEPVSQGETTVIPCAEVLSTTGFAFGTGYGSGGNEAATDKGGSGGGGGGGGGGRVLSRPVAVIEIRPEGVRVQPIMDLTKISLAGITAWGFMLAMIMRMMTRRRHMPKP